MPELDLPPNPIEPRSPEAGTPLPLARGRWGRYEDMEHHELIRLLDTIEDEQARSRFRESVYISVLICTLLAWFVFYGPRVLFHQGRIVLPADVLKERDREMTYLNLPPDLKKLPPPKDAKAIADQTTRAQTAKPTLDRKTLEQLRRAGTPGEASPRPAAPRAQPAPAQPAPPTPQPAAPQPAAPKPQQPVVQAARPAAGPPLPSAPTRQPATAVPDAPRPSQQQPTRPNFGTPASPGDQIRAAANAAARGAGGDYGTATAPSPHNGINTGVEVLSDTLGVDFGPYIKRILRMIYNSWVPLIPEETRPPLSKEGSTLIRFTINPNGVIAHMSLDASTHDQAIDRAAWGGIQGVGQFPPLPANFKGPNLELRIQFSITHQKTAAE